MFRRILQAIVVVFGVVIVTFILYQLFPGGPVAVARIIQGPKATAASIQTFINQQGLNKSIPEQFWRLLSNVVQLKLGYSYKEGQPVWSIIRLYLPRTLLLIGISTVLALIIAIPLGMIQVLRRNKVTDYVLTALSFIFYATPTFFLGLILIQVFALHWHLFPAEAPQAQTVTGILAQWRGLVLPVCTLAAVSIAGFSRYMRSSLMEQLTEDYIRTARAKGLRGRRIMFVHALRNALIPIVTLLGLSFGYIAGGAVITESVFNYPGMGLLFINSALESDFPLIIGTTLVIAVATVIGSLVADLCYAALDPRIRYVS